jgi:hypothetical protein
VGSVTNVKVAHPTASKRRGLVVALHPAPAVAVAVVVVVAKPAGGTRSTVFDVSTWTPAKVGGRPAA